VVIGIIAALIAILLPALAAAREQARRVRCVSNVRQLTMAWLMYASDNKGHICSAETQCTSANAATLQIRLDYAIGGTNPPTVLGADGKPVKFWSWIGDGGAAHDIPAGMIWHYLRDVHVYECPDKPDLPNTWYAVNGMLAGRMGTPMPFFTLGEVKHSESVFVFIEAQNHRDDGDGDFDNDETAVKEGRIQGGFGSPLYPGFFCQPVGNFHKLGGNNGTSISFADGHAIFWQYSSPDTASLNPNLVASNTARLAGGNPDVKQLQAWSGGRMPPGVMR
jgi:hypothetical protein